MEGESVSDQDRSDFTYWDYQSSKQWEGTHAETRAVLIATGDKKTRVRE